MGDGEAIGKCHSISGTNLRWEIGNHSHVAVMASRITASGTNLFLEQTVSLRYAIGKHWCEKKPQIDDREAPLMVAKVATRDATVCQCYPIAFPTEA